MDFEKHPCFSAEARHTTGRIHLPVAPNCNIQCNFCNRKYDCVNESRPGVSSSVLKPDQALTYLDSVLARIDNLAVVGIAGPGDPFATPEETVRTLELVHEKYPEKILCLASNGLGLAPYAERIAKLNLSHVTITMNAIDPAIGAQIYAWVRFGPHVYRGEEGARILLENQTAALKKLKEFGITVKINTVIIPGINDTHAAEVAEYCAKFGADVQNCIPLMHVEGTAFEGREVPDAALMLKVRAGTSKFLKQMSHCARCRADAVGLLGQTNPEEVAALMADAKRIKPTAERPRFAVGSMEGLFVNRHLGEAPAFWVFEKKGGEIVLVEQRPTPAPGSGDARWEELAKSFSDCAAVLVSGCGPTPQKILENSGLRVVAVEGLIRDILPGLFDGKELPAILIRRPGMCGAGKGCTGSGNGCM